MTASTSTRAIIWHFWTASCSAPTATSPRCSTGSPTRQRPREAEFITVFYGEDVNEEDARKACDAFTRKCPDAEVNLICGGQPVYYYIISIE